MMRRRSGQGSQVLRLRARRVLSAFLRLRREVGKQVEVFDAEQLKRMLWSGQPDDARYYLQRFLPVSGADWSELCTKLVTHVGTFKTLAKVVAGGEEGDRIASLFAKPQSYYLENPARSGLNEIIAVIHADRTRGSMLWQKLKPGGVDRIMDLVARCPELQGKATFNSGEKHSARSRNSSATPYMKMVQIAPEPAVLEGLSHAPIMSHAPHIMRSPSNNSGIFSSATNAAVAGDQGANSTVLEKQGISTGLDTKLPYA